MGVGTIDLINFFCRPAKARRALAKARSSRREHELSDEVGRSIEFMGLFDASAYLRIHDDVRKAGEEPWTHFRNCGMSEGRQFTSLQSVAKALSRCDNNIQRAMVDFEKLVVGNANEAIDEAACVLRSRGAVIGIFRSSSGTCVTKQIAKLVHWQMAALGIDSKLRDQESDPNEFFNIRIFIGPQEFFSFGRGRVWNEFSGAPGSVLLNVEQVQAPGFARALVSLRLAPLVLDINFHNAALLREIGCNAIHYMPPYLPGCKYTSPQLDISHMDVVRGYDFSRELFDWTTGQEFSDRPIDILFVSDSERQAKAIETLRGLTDEFRFICIKTDDRLSKYREYQDVSAEVNWTLAQRSKIFLNIHPDWIGLFDWSKMVMPGLWQGACVVSDPGLPGPVFAPGSHYIEEAVRHLPDLLRWLLGTIEGRVKMNEVAAAGHSQAAGAAATAMLLPMLHSLQEVMN
jgi:hypothetical protein